MTNKEYIQTVDKEKLTQIIFNLLDVDCKALFHCPKGHPTRCNGHCKENISNWLDEDDEKMTRREEKEQNE